MPTIDSKTNVYEITRSTIPSIIDIQQYVDNRVHTEVNNWGDSYTDIGGMTREEFEEWLETWVNGFNFIYNNNSNDSTSWSTLELGLRAKWTEDIQSATGITMEAIANDYYSRSEIDSFSYATYDEATAYVDTRMVAYADSVKAIAYKGSLLEATYDGITARINEDAMVYAGESRVVEYSDDPCSGGEPSDGIDAAIGDIAKYVSGTDIAGFDIYACKQYIGSNTMANGCSWIVTNIANNIQTFGTAKSLYTDPVTGDIVGWEYIGNSSGLTEFVVSTNSFKIRDSNGSKVPLKVENGVTTIGANTVPRFLGSGNSYTGEAHNGDTFRYTGATTEYLTNNTIYMYNNGVWTSTKGERGPATVSHTAEIESPSDNDIQSMFRWVSGLDTYVKGDVLEYTYYKESDKENSYTKKYNRNDYTATNWDSYVLRVNGNAIVEGTLSAKAITTGTLDVEEVYGDELTIGGGEWGPSGWSILPMPKTVVTPTSSSTYNYLGNPGTFYFNNLISPKGIRSSGSISINSGYSLYTESIKVSEPKGLYLTDDNGDLRQIGIDTSGNLYVI